MTSAESAAQGDEAAGHEARVAELKRAMPQWIATVSGHQDGPARNPSLPTLVGLFILILCFFVLLTSISLRDKTRESTVMASLARTFSGTGAAPQTATAEAEDQTRKLLGDLQTELNAEVPLVSGVAPTTSDDYVLRLPRGLVFSGDGAELAPGFPNILKQALAALKVGPADFAYEIEAVLSSPQLDDKAVEAGAMVGKALRAAGFANDAAVVSLQAGKADVVTLTIRLRPNARLAPTGPEPAPAAAP